MELIQTLVSLGTFAAVIVGGAWALYKIRKTRQFAHRIRFEVSVDFVARYESDWIVSVDAEVVNEGQVRHNVKEFRFELRYLREGDQIVESDDLGGQVVIPHVVREGSWLPPNWPYFFIEPGLSAKYSFVASVPAEAKVVLLHGFLDYSGTPYIHTAERLMRVPA